MTDRNHRILGVPWPAAMMAAALLLWTGCATGGTAYQEVSPDFAESFGCSTASSASSPTPAEGRPSEGLDACAVLSGWGSPDRVDHLRIGEVRYQTWLYPDMTIIVMNEDCPGGECVPDSTWEVIYSG